MYRWKGQKGMGNLCSKCNAKFSDEEFDFEEDKCTYCVFPEITQSRPAEIDYSLGYPRNQTEMGYVMENLERIPEELSKAPIGKNDRKVLQQIKQHKRKSYK
jgi:hypothetical protein